MLAYTRGMPIMPREANPDGGSFDARTEARGSGAFRLTKRTVSVSSVFERNPDWFDADKVYLDGFELYVIPEYATQMAQFRTGALWSNSSIRQEDILPTKREMPQLIMQEGVEYDRGPRPWISLGTLPGSPFLDERVRRALSMLLDRELYISTFENLENFTREGLPVEPRWNSHVMAGFDGFWIDPKSKEIGEGGKNFEYNPAEAKSLLRAAGHTKAIETTLNYPLNAYGQEFNNQCDTYRQMWEANGDFKFKTNHPDYRSQWLAAARPDAKPGEWNGAYHFGRGTYEGIALGSGNDYPDVDGQVQAYFREGSIRQMRAYEDKYLDDLVDKQRRELDREKRIEIVKELQRYTAKTMPGMMNPGNTPPFTLAHPWIGNRGLWRGGEDTQLNYMHLWYDQSKKST
jgi:ABC-type transport system substrate-binding protein